MPYETIEAYVKYSDYKILGLVTKILFLVLNVESDI